MKEERAAHFEWRAVRGTPCPLVPDALTGHRGSGLHVPVAAGLMPKQRSISSFESGAWSFSVGVSLPVQWCLSLVAAYLLAGATSRRLSPSL